MRGKTNLEHAPFGSDDYKFNAEVLKLCELTKPKKDPIDIEKARVLISGDIPADYVRFPLDAYSKEKYNQEISNLSSELCQIQNDQSKCEKFQYSCDILKMMNSPLAASLASASNPKVNEVLRSIVGKGINNLSPISSKILEDAVPAAFFLEDISFESDTYISDEEFFYLVDLPKKSIVTLECVVNKKQHPFSF